jgi:hypothetical protein
VMMSQTVTARTQESRMILHLTSYTNSAIMQLHAMPARTIKSQWLLVGLLRLL